MAFEKLIFAAYSCRNFYQRFRISKYIIEQGQIPINPFLLEDYDLAGLVEHERIRELNNSLAKRCDELWIFGDIADGVVREEKIFLELKKPVYYFSLSHEGEINKTERSKLRRE